MLGSACPVSRTARRANKPCAPGYTNAGQLATVEDGVTTASKHDQKRTARLRAVLLTGQAGPRRGHAIESVRSGKLIYMQGVEIRPSLSMAKA